MHSGRMDLAKAMQFPSVSDQLSARKKFTPSKPKPSTKDELATESYMAEAINEFKEFKIK